MTKRVIYSLAGLIIPPEANLWNTFVSVIPWFNCQADALRHCNSVTRCVTILTISFTVLISTIYYETLLLSSFLIKDPPVAPLSMQDIVQYCVGCTFCFETQIY